MLCNRCGGSSEVVDTRFKQGLWVTVRKRTCLRCGHKFRTFEMHVGVHYSDEKKMRAFVKAARARIDLRLRQIEIARKSHLGWKYLSEIFNLSRSGVYYAIRKGREHIRKERN